MTRAEEDAMETPTKPVSAEEVDAWVQKIRDDIEWAVGDAESLAALLQRLAQERDEWQKKFNAECEKGDKLAFAAQQAERELAEAKAAAAKAREENLILTNVLNQARETLLISIKAPEELQPSLGKLNLACKAHWDWQTERAALRGGKDREGAHEA